MQKFNSRINALALALTALSVAHAHFVKTKEVKKGDHKVSKRDTDKLNDALATAPGVPNYSFFLRAETSAAFTDRKGFHIQVAGTPMSVSILDKEVKEGEKPDNDSFTVDYVLDEIMRQSARLTVEKTRLENIVVNADLIAQSLRSLTEARERAEKGFSDDMAALFPEGVPDEVEALTKPEEKATA